MNADQLLALYHRVTEAPDAVFRLRRFVLDLAVRGKLVAQDPADEPASELLKRILAERARLVKAGEVKRPTGDPAEDSAPPFALPSSWTWSRIEAVVRLEMGQSPPSESYNQDGFGIAFFQGKTDFGERHPTPRYWCTRPSKIAESGDVLLSVRAPVGPTNVADVRCCIGRGLAALRPFAGLDREFMLRALNAFEADLEAMGFGTTFVAINKKQLTQFPFPLPPLAEQRRIVAKVEELMALCDRLEAARTAREVTRDRLTAASLARLTAPDTDAAIFPNHARFALETLPALTARPDQIKPLRQTILNLAVRGKLVEQDANDEPAEELFAQLQTLTTGAKQKTKRISATDLPFEIPPSWTLTHLDAVTRVISGNAFQSGDFQKESGIRAIKITNVGVRKFKETDEFLPTGFELRFAKFLVKEGDILIALTRPYIVGGLKVVRCPVSYDRSLLNQRVGAIQTAKDKDISKFLYLYLCSDFVLEYVIEESRTLNQPNLNIPDLRRLPFPLPPLAEQHRIVAKVDELMALCDRLEANLDQSAATRRRLLDALLHKALVPAAGALEAAE